MKTFALITVFAFVSCATALPLVGDKDILALLEKNLKRDDLSRQIAELTKSSQTPVDAGDLQYIYNASKSLSRPCDGHKLGDLGVALSYADRILNPQLKQIGKSLLQGVTPSNVGLECLGELTQMAQSSVGDDKLVQQWMDKISNGLSQTSKNNLFFYTIARDSEIYDNEELKNQVFESSETRDVINSVCAKIDNKNQIHTVTEAIRIMLNSATIFRTEEVKEELRKQLSETGPTGIKLATLALFCNSYIDFLKVNIKSNL